MATVIDPDLISTPADEDKDDGEGVDNAAALDSLAATLFRLEREEAAARPPRRPSATYRLQMHGKFRFEDAAAVVDYLHDLGVSDAYFSPYLAARAGSTHGYDVIDHGRLNPEVGTEAEHAGLVNRLASFGMGRLLDIVPNHMGFDTTNPFMLDVLENGPQALWSNFFDIEWNPVKDALTGRLLLPVLEDFYGKVLNAGLITLEREGGQFWVRYHDRKLPLRPRSYAAVLNRRADEFAAKFDPNDEDVVEYLSIRDASAHLPARLFNSLEEVAEMRREKVVIKRRLQRLCEDSPRLRSFIDGNIQAFHGTPGAPESFDALHELLETQIYRLAYWRVAAEEINYRRFFDVTDLAGIRVEDPVVFGHVHKLIFQWVGEGGVTGLRVDHPDGLADPLGYFQRVQERLFVQACLRRPEAAGADARVLSPRLATLFRDDLAQVDTPLARRYPIVAEKILSSGEKLPADWPIDGTVGYEYLNALNGLFVNPEAADAVDAAYREFTGDDQAPAEALHASKLLVERSLLASELNNLAHRLSEVAESGRSSRDFTLNDLRRVLVEVVACFRVYRTYIREGGEVSQRDRDYVEQAVSRARRRLPTVDSSVFAFVRDVLQLNFPADVSADGRTLWEKFVVRFQQTTGPTQAKGLEDTTFYRQVPLLSLNEVGGDPSRFGSTPAAFHALNAHRLADWPGGLSTTSTHDTKRGEDARIRINVISELTDEWKTRLARWSRWNSRKKVVVNEKECPDAREEYLFYQTLIGVWPFGGPDEGVPEGLIERVQAYMVKAASEAKRNTNWTDPDPSYKESLSKFVADVLGGDDAAPFLNDFLPFQRRVARVAVNHSLAQALLKVVSPGVPDTYQGCELWDLSMVDPDNRRPVDFEARRAALGMIRRSLDGGTPEAELARRLYASPEDGAVKLYLLWKALNHRKGDGDLYLKGAYRPVESSGAHKEKVVGCLRSYQGRHVLAVVPRLVASLMGDDALTPPVGPEVWGDTEVLLPESSPDHWRDLLTGERREGRTADGKTVFRAGDLFRDLPVALLAAEGPPG